MAWKSILFARRHGEMGMKRMVAAIAVLAALTTGCAGRTYSDRVTAEPLAEGASRSAEVLGAAGEWRNAGVMVEAGTQYRITARGRWHGGGICGWTEADGIGANPFCVAQYPHLGSLGLLIGKIGPSGRPFAIGRELTFTPKRGGALFLIMNDVDWGRGDNQGTVTAEIARVAKPLPRVAEAKASPLPASAPTFPVAPLPVTYPKGDPRPDDIAVIIGNADYSKLGKDLPNVPPARADAASFRRYAREALGIREGNIIYMENATQAQMLKVFGSREDHRGRLFNWARPGRSRIVVYYAGHGAPGSDGKNAYLVPVDAESASIALNGYPLDLLLGNLGRIPSPAVHVVLESCFSGLSQGGTVLKNASALMRRPRAPQLPANVTLVTAAASDQIASWDAKGEHGLFTRYYLTGMSGAADAKPYGNGDGNVTLRELGIYLKETMTYRARRHYGRDQEATIMQHPG